MNRLMKRIADNRDSRSLASTLRARRTAAFMRFIEPLERPVNMLDIGGTPRFWRAAGLAGDMDYRITLLNLRKVKGSHADLRVLAGDATDLSRFREGEFDVVYSNSVIEHVGDLEAQRAMAREARRVGRAYFIETPNRYFPIEPHFLVPLFQFLPVSIRVGLVRRFGLGWYRRVPDPERARALVVSHRLLTHKEMRELFPEASLLRERFAGLTKSLIACGSSGSSALPPPDLSQRRLKRQGRISQP